MVGPGPSARWEDLLLVYLHDPFDKALDIRGHERRAARYASAALGRDVSPGEMKRAASLGDRLAAMHERVPMPTAGAGGERAVGPADGLSLIHPLSAAAVAVGGRPIDPGRAEDLIARIVDGLASPRERFLALWRLLPDRVAEELGSDAARLPADTRLPDHTLFQHADITAGLHSAASGSHGMACLSFALGPVQPFIAAARSVRDLWTGSAILSWLAFQAMKPVLERFGPTAFVYPALRGAPLVDLWLRREVGLADRAPKPSSSARRAPSLPHRFVALAPWGRDGSDAGALRQECLDSVRTAWRGLAQAVREELDCRFSPLSPGWDRFWDRQIDDAFEFHVTLAPQSDLNDERLDSLLGEVPDHAIRSLGEAIPVEHRPRYLQNHAGRWQARMEVSARQMAAERSVRPVPASSGSSDWPSPPKCSLFGSWEQMGPAEFAASRRFWRQAVDVFSSGWDGVRLRSRERFCAVALTKRFAAPARLARDLELEREEVRFPDTATIAARNWLRRAGIDPDAERDEHGVWSGQWLHWNRPDEGGEDERPVPGKLWRRIREAKGRQAPPPTYYAVIAMDGDRLGEWLAGRRTPQLRHLVHQKIRGYFEALGGSGAAAALDARRHVGPALHASISSALGAFATEFAPGIVREHQGETIYSGGDDVLALCPVDGSLACALALRRAFSGTDDPAGDGWRRSVVNPAARRITMGADASMSAGVAIVHFRADLRQALDEARRAERAAKDAGRDRMQLVSARRSGERAAADCPWPFVERVDGLRKLFEGGASNRWTYKLRAEAPTLASDSLPRAAMASEIRRLVEHGAVSGGEAGRGAEMADLFERYCEMVRAPRRPRASRRADRVQDRASRAGRDADFEPGAAPSDGVCLERFVILCQSAAFMARGRDD